MSDIEQVFELAHVAGFPVATDRSYDAETHFWVLPIGPGRLRVGMDALGVETSGTLAQLSLEPVGTKRDRGEPLGRVEAAKFVGPLTCPVSGVVAAVNDAVLADAGLLERDPYGAGWLAEVEVDDVEDATAELVHGAHEVLAWFAAQVADYRLKGVIAE